LGLAGYHIRRHASKRNNDFSIAAAGVVVVVVVFSAIAIIEKSSETGVLVEFVIAAIVSTIR
jgi:hypothetical protein